MELQSKTLKELKELLYNTEVELAYDCGARWNALDKEILEIKKEINMKNWQETNHKVSNWILEYAKKSKIESLVIGVSGGIDSAVVSYLCALTGMKVYVVSMPIHQPQSHLVRANNHIDWLIERFPNVEKLEIDLTSEFDLLDIKLSSITGNNPLCSANTRSRLRMSTLYAIATAFKGIVVGTGNKVEDFGVGFFTKYGDGGVDISPIASFMKSEVKLMAIAANFLLEIINAIPSDGLWEGDRTDEDQIGASYDELEWAMKYMTRYSTYPEIVELEDDLTTRQKEIVRIYHSFHTKNQHKMLPIPIYSETIPSYTN